MTEQDLQKELKDIRKRLKDLERPHVPVVPEDMEYFAPEIELDELALQVEVLLETLRLHAPKFYRKYDAAYTKQKND